MEIISPMQSNNIQKFGRCQSAIDIQDGRNIMWDAEVQGVNKKLMRLAVDSRSKRQSLMYDESLPRSRSSTLLLRDEESSGSLRNLKITQLNDCDNARFPRMEAMSHFHYNNVDFGGPINVSLCIEEDLSEVETGKGLLVEVTAKNVSWVVKRSLEDFVGLDRQIHRCLYDRRYSLLSVLSDSDSERSSVDMVHKLQGYLSRFSKLGGNNVNCGPILNWLELDNHGNHLVVMEADDSAINVPAIAAGRVIKRYQAQAADEITLDVGEFLSIIDMPPVEETIWWRGKKGFEVGFFPSHCIEILGGKDVTDKVISNLQSRPVSKRRGKFITFLRFFFKSRPSKDELMQHGILRERVFGCDLGERLALVGRDIPLVLEMCSSVIEEYGVVDGIYRLSGILSNLQRLRVAFDNDDDPPDLRDPKYLNDIHCISSLLKTYFRELPNPLFTYELYDKFVAAINKEDDTERIVAFHHVIQRLPPPHYRTMNALLKHLNFCSSKAKETNMTTKNLAIVWAPNLLRPNIDDSVGALTEFRTQAIIVEYMIRNVDVFFNSNLASAAIAYYPEVEMTVASSRTVSMNMGPKLITLEEAQQRMCNHRSGSESSFSEYHSNSPCQKLRTAVPPPTVAAAPISPLPTLLTLEEAQARKKVNLNIMRRGSADLVEMRSSTSYDSPKRNKKWFGLFSRSKSITHDEDVIKNGENAVYRKRRSTNRRNLEISAPARSQSDMGLEIGSPNFSSSEHRGRSETTRTESNYDDVEVDVHVPQVDGDLDIRMSRDSDVSLMSAIASVSAKYSSFKDHMRSNHRRSLTIGEPSEFRRLSYRSSKAFFSNPESDNVAGIKKDSIDCEIDESLKSDTYVPPDVSVNYLTNKDAVSDRISSIDSERVKHRSMKHLESNVISNVPAKRIRSFSPENYENSSINIIDSVTTTSHKSENMKLDFDTNKGNNTSEPLQVDTLPAAGDYSACPNIEQSESSKADEKRFDETVENRESASASTSTVFQLVSMPAENDSSIKNSIEMEGLKIDRDEVISSNLDPKGLDLDADKKAELDNYDNYVLSVSISKASSNSLNTESRSNEPVSHSKNNRSDSKYCSDQLNETCEPKSEFDCEKLPRSTSNCVTEIVDNCSVGNCEQPISPLEEKSLECPVEISEKLVIPTVNAIHIPQRDYLDTVNEGDNVETNVLVKATLARLKPGFTIDSNTRSTSFIHKCGYSVESNRKTRSSSVEMMDGVDLPPRAKCQSCNFDVKENRNSSSSKNELYEVDLRSFHKDDIKSCSGPPELHKVRIKSTPNLYIRTDYSSKPPVAPKPDCKTTNTRLRSCDHPIDKRHSSVMHAHINSDESLRCPRDSSKDSKKTHRLSLNLNRLNENSESIQGNGDLSTNKKYSRKSRSSPATDKLVVSSVYRTKDLAKPQKPRPLSEVQKPLRESSNSSVSNADQNTCGVKETSMIHNASPTQHPFLSLLNKSLSENYLHDDENGKKIGHFPLTLKNGSSPTNRTSQTRNIMKKKHDSRPLSMYDNIRQSRYDNMCAVQYELV